jgi:hypothetical protein
MIANSRERRKKLATAEKEGKCGNIRRGELNASQQQIK